jgi:hypothetical protein
MKKKLLQGGSCFTNCVMVRTRIHIITCSKYSLGVRILLVVNKKNTSTGSHDNTTTSCKKKKNKNHEQVVVVEPLGVPRVVCVVRLPTPLL